MRQASSFGGPSPHNKALELPAPTEDELAKLREVAHARVPLYLETSAYVCEERNRIYVLSGGHADVRAKVSRS